MHKFLMLIAFTAAALSVAAQPKYVVVDLGSVGAPSTQTSALAINKAGQVVGNSSLAVAPYSYRAYRTAPNKPINPATDLIPLPAGATYNAIDTNSLNSSGQVAFNAGLSDGFRLDADGTTHDLGNLGGVSRSNAWAINDSGQITGQSDIAFGAGPCFAFGQEPAFRTAPNSAIAPADNLGSLLGTCRYALGIGINASGQVVGYSAALSLFNPSQHAFLATPSSAMHDLGVLGGTISTAYAINASGQIVGDSTYTSLLPQYLQPHHAFLTTASGPLQDLGTLGGSYSTASGINASGEIVGAASTTGDAAYDGFLYVGGTMVDLNSLIAPGSGWSIANAWGINDSGQIVATGKLLSDGTYHPLRLDPADVAVTILTSLLSDPTLGLTGGQIASLTDKLNNAIASIQAGLNKQAINQLNALISSVQSSVKNGKISAQTGNTLIADANAIIATL
jgi:probable HAF family extracellular repeat protein